MGLAPKSDKRGKNWMAAAQDSNQQKHMAAAIWA